MPSKQARRRRGGIRERGGVFQVRVHVGIDPVTGQRVDLTGKAATEREADKLLTRFLAEKDARRAARSRITLGEACDRWLANLDVEVKTKHEYGGYVRRTLRPALGPVPLARLDALAIESLYAQLRRCRRLCRPAFRRSITGPIGTICATSGARRASAARWHRRRSGRCTPS